MCKLARVWQSFTQRFARGTGDLHVELRGAGGRGPAPAWPSLMAQVETALQEWHAAQQYFGTVSDPELVDHAIYTMEAARRKYMYLLKQVHKHRQQLEEA